jgi:hypothetical protein
MRAAIIAAVRDLAGNLRAGLALAAFRRPRALHGTPRQLALLFVLTLFVGLAYDLYAAGGEPGHLDAYALPSISFWVLGVLLAAWLSAAIAAGAARFTDGTNNTDATDAADRLRSPPLAAAGFALYFWASAASCALAVAADRWSSVERWYGVLAWLPLLWAAAAYGWASVRLARVDSRRRRAAIFLIAAMLIAVPQWAVDPSSRLWVAASAVDDEPASGPDAPQSEQTLYGQFDLLNDALDAIAPAQAGITELFTISFAGDGEQDVFFNEAVGADAVMAAAFDSGEHSVVLANSRAHALEHPFATASALQRAVSAVADRMNGDEDVLALFLTSHGTPDHRLVVSLPPYDFTDLSPEALRSMLDESGIRYRVIIVSSCYSGGFVEALAGNDTMVITASSADRTSFGCRDGADWTDFGRAYFAEALAQTASFEGAFRIASRRIAEREAQEHLTPSLPQISVGAGIRDQLQRLETRRGGRILSAAARARGRASVHTVALRTAGHIRKESRSLPWQSSAGSSVSPTSASRRCSTR